MVGNSLFLTSGINGVNLRRQKRFLTHPESTTNMSWWTTVALLIVSNVFMTFAWYGQLKLEQLKVITPATPLILVILGSWAIALLEYCFMVPANKYGFVGNGGAFNLLQLKVIQEVVSLAVFTMFVILFFKGECLHWNHFVAFCLLILAVYFVFMDS